MEVGQVSGGAVERGGTFGSWSGKLWVRYKGSGSCRSVIEKIIENSCSMQKLMICANYTGLKCS